MSGRVVEYPSTTRRPGSTSAAVLAGPLVGSWLQGGCPPWLRSIERNGEEWVLEYVCRNWVAYSCKRIADGPSRCRRGSHWRGRSCRGRRRTIAVSEIARNRPGRKRGGCRVGCLRVCSPHICCSSTSQRCSVPRVPIHRGARPCARNEPGELLPEPQ